MFPELDLVVRTLESGQILLYPTDTIWGIGCDCTAERAVQKIYTVKRRHESKSLILLVDSLEMLGRYVPNMPGKLLKIHTHFSRPLTMIYDNTQHLPDFLKAEDGSLAIRIVQDPFCQAVIAAFGKPIVSTSANRSGSESPKNFNDIDPELKQEMDYIVLHRQRETKENQPSVIARYHNDTDELEVLRGKL